MPESLESNPLTEDNESIVLPLCRRRWPAGGTNLTLFAALSTTTTATSSWRSSTTTEPSLQRTAPTHFRSKTRLPAKAAPTSPACPTSTGQLSTQTSAVSWFPWWQSYKACFIRHRRCGQNKRSIMLSNFFESLVTNLGNQLECLSLAILSSIV